MDDSDDDSDYPIKRKTKEVTKSDLYSLIKIYMSAYKNMPEYADVENEDTAARYILHYFRYSDLEKLKILVNNEIAGFIFVETDTDELIIHELVVDPKYRGMKIGKDLLDIVEHLRNEYNCEKVSLYVGENNYRAKKIYRKFGFCLENENSKWLKMSYIVKPNESTKGYYYGRRVCETKSNHRRKILEKI